MFSDVISATNSAPLPGNSQETYLVDSTRWNDTPWVAAASASAPSKSRGQLAGARITGTILPTAQDVTVTFELLVNPTGTTSSAFAADVNVSGTGGDGILTVASGATQPFSWLPSTPDWRIRITAGATAPTALATTMVIALGDRASGA